MLPKFLQPFAASAQRYLANPDLIEEIEFSGATYQIKIKEPQGDAEAWAFIQLDNQGRIKDSFCSCEQTGDTAGCVHIAVAFLSIYHEQPTPLHQRFQQSLWHRLCFLCADKLGYETSALKKQSEGAYGVLSPSGKVIVSIKATTKAMQKKLHQLMEERQIETEETSLKFSNLTQEELSLWRKGIPSLQLMYELSFWNDLAKWLMLLQEAGEKYKISFRYAASQLPNEIIVQFPGLSLSFYISEANLPLIIPSLATVQSPLQVFHALSGVDLKIYYDEQEKVLHIDSPDEVKKRVPKPDISGISIPGWLFVPGEGFFSQEKMLLQNQSLRGEMVAQALNEQGAFISTHLQGSEFNDTPTTMHYELTFDGAWNLHIAAYLFEKGDLSQPNSALFGNTWAYLQDDGFYKVVGVHFDAIEKVVLEEDIVDFVDTQRAWLNEHEGFHTHLASVDAQLSFIVGSAGELSFRANVEIPEGEIDSHDFGNWVYIRGMGFYPKARAASLPLSPQPALAAHEVARFIGKNEEELRLVPHFFSPICPVIQVQLDVVLDEEKNIHVVPRYILSEDFQDTTPVVYEHYVYVPGSGFSFLPPALRVPIPFHAEVIIPLDQQDEFLIETWPTIAPWVGETDPCFKKPNQKALIAQSITPIEEQGQEGFVLKLGYETELGFIDVTTLWSGMQQENRFLLSSAGLIDLEDPTFRWLKNLKKQKVDRRSKALTMSTLEFIRLIALEDVHPPYGRSAIFQRTREILEEIKSWVPPEKPDASGLKSTLRPYQETGLVWLWFLYRHNLSGLLCDDMGLGKTHQAMALLAAILNFHKNTEDKRLRFIVICPTSVIYHWQDKLRSFFPTLQIHTYYGGERDIQAFTEKDDLFLTSYGIWRRDAELIGKIPFELAIFDEVQVAKSHMSQLHQSLLGVQAKMRLGLTGTPIENQLREIKSLFDVVLPGYMPHEAEYRDFFVRPIERDGDVSRRELLSRFVKPFILRRRKGDVLDDLPEKVEQIAQCDLSSEQHTLYQHVLYQSRDRLLQELQDETTPIPYIHIFSLLSSLKQICNHPAAYAKEPQDYRQHSSGKWDLFVELLEEARGSGQKVVVFSQYLAMLDIIELYLSEHQIGFAGIRGSTTDREEPVRRFNQDPTCEVFVASLRAAGLGIDLTAASVVIHYDRWWNAARENQATDRVHRIGQTRGVQVFKMVTQGTFEERIDQMIQKKGQLMEDVIGADEQYVVKLFSRQELATLLQDVS